MNDVQNALKHGPRRYRELLTFTGKPEIAREVAANLLEHLEQEEYSAVLNVLVALPLAALPAQQREQFAREADSAAALDAGLALVVQIAAENADDVTFARRLVQFVVHDKLEIKDELRGDRRLLSRENFGFRDGVEWNEARRSEAKAAVAGASAPWLLYQRCDQDVTGFPGDSKTRDAIKETHAASMKRLEGSLLRRSFSFESWRNAGLAFLAVARSARELLAAHQAFAERDALRAHVTLDNASRGLFVVPPTSAWLRAGAAAPERKTLPQWVLDFRKKHAYEQYEVTPSTMEFMREAFAKNSKNLRDGDKLRSDIDLIGQGLAKMLLGHKLPKGSLSEQLLELMFGPRSRQPSPGTPALDAATLSEIREEMRQADLASPVLNTELERLVALARKGAEEAYLVNQEAGPNEYVTFSI